MTIESDCEGTLWKEPARQYGKKLEAINDDIHRRKIMKKPVKTATSVRIFWIPDLTWNFRFIVGPAPISAEKKQLYWNPLRANAATRD